jgi:hypothetical protein
MTMAKRVAKQRAPRLKRKCILGYVPEEELAKQLNVQVRTLRKWRRAGAGPPYVKVGREVHYRDEACAAWLKSQEVQPVRAQAA